MITFGIVLFAIGMVLTFFSFLVCPFSMVYMFRNMGESTTFEEAGKGMTPFETGVIAIVGAWMAGITFVVGLLQNAGLM